MTREQDELSEHRHNEQFDPDPDTGAPDVSSGYCGKVDDDALIAAMMPWIEIDDHEQLVTDQLANLNLAAASATRGGR